MSTYIDSRNPKKHGDFSDCPELVIMYLRDIQTIRGLSARTVNGYYIDLRIFFKYVKVLHKLTTATFDELQDVDIKDIDLGFIKKISSNDIYEFLHFVTRSRENNPAARARKLSSLKGFFKYICNKRKLLDVNPTDDIDSPAQKKRLPKYLTLNDSMKLLQNISSDFYERDFCIIMLFLNCGMRLSELISINHTDINYDDNTLRIIGKGDKERIVYLNSACVEAINVLIEENKGVIKLQEKKALFISKKTGKRLSARRVQQIVESCLAAAGLSGRGYSPHKLRHTAATMMYQEGNVDMLALKEILGHAHVSTTEIYTHLSSQHLKNAAEASPFSKVKVKKEEDNTAKKNNDADE